MRHPTYKHLEGKLRLAAFSIGQWAQITAAGVAAAVFGGYVSPLPTQLTIFVAIVGAGLPVAVSYGATDLEFSVAQFPRAGWRYWRDPRRYLAGAGAPSGLAAEKCLRPFESGRDRDRGADPPRRTSKRSAAGSPP